MDLNMNAWSQVTQKKSNGFLFKEARNTAFHNCCPRDLCEMCVQVLEYCICCARSGQHLLCGLSLLKCYTESFILKFCRFILWIFLLIFHMNLCLWSYCSFHFFSVYGWLTCLINNLFLVRRSILIKACSLLVKTSQTLEKMDLYISCLEKHLDSSFRGNNCELSSELL